VPTETVFTRSAPNTDTKEPSPSTTEKQLKLALAIPTAQSDQLTAYLLTITRNHLAEKVLLERWILTLEAEKCEKGRQGLTQ
jgi:hypothetical protein